MNRQSATGCTKPVLTEENADLVESLICLQKDQPGTPMSPREIKKRTGISWSSFKVQENGWKDVAWSWNNRRLKTPQKNAAAKERRAQFAGELRSSELLPASPECSPLDYRFWNVVNYKVYEGRFDNPFATLGWIEEEKQKGLARGCP